MQKSFITISQLRQDCDTTSQQVCPHTNFVVGAGLKPGEESRRCSDCKSFLGYSPVSQLKKARRRKGLTESLEILESRGIQGELALFCITLASGGEA